MTPTQAYAKREFWRFLSAIGFKDCSLEELQALITEMKETTRRRGMSEDDMATIYEADDLLDIYREARARRH